jgi:hypothetical protein
LVFYLFSAATVGITFAILPSVTTYLPDEQKQYLAGLTVIDHLVSLLILSLKVAAAVQLFRLKKSSAILFPSALLVSLLFAAWHGATKGWYAAMGQSGLTGALLGWAVTVAVCIYAWVLAKKGVLG